MLATAFLCAGALVSATQAQPLDRRDALDASRVNVTDFGAIPDDKRDDAPAIRAALKRAQELAGSGRRGVEVYFPAGVYDVAKPERPADRFHPWVILPLDRGGFTMRSDAAPDGSPGGLATIRVMDGQGEYESLLGGRIFQSDLDDLRVVDLTLDGNGANNPVLDGDASVGSIYTNKRYAFRTYWGDRVTFERCRFTDWRNVNVLVFNGTEVADPRVAGCLFDTIGDLSRVGPDWDHSSIYTDSDGAEIVDNVFASVGVGAFGVRTAIETHGPRQIVTGNSVTAFSCGINVTGVSVLGSDVHRVENNRFIDVANGVMIWAYEAEGNTPGAPVLTDCLIRGNEIVLNIDGWRDTQDQFGQASCGVLLFGQSDGAIDGLTIEGNTIRYTGTDGDPRAYDRNSVGIRLVAYAVEDLPMRGVLIRKNVIEGAPSTGITLGGDFSSGVTIEGNRVVDAGSGHAGISGGLRTGVMLYGAYADVRLLDNAFVDTGPETPHLEQVIYGFDTNLGGCVARGNSVETSSGKEVRVLRAEGESAAGWTVR